MTSRAEGYRSTCSSPCLLFQSCIGLNPRHVPRHVSWLRPFLNQDPRGLIARNSLPRTFFQPAIGYVFVLPAIGHVLPCQLLAVLFPPAVGYALLVLFLSTCCAWYTARPDLLVLPHVLLVELGCWMSALKVSASVTGAVVELLIVRPRLEGPSVWQPTGQHRTRRQAQAVSLRCDYVSWSARHCCRAVQVSKLIKPSSPDLWPLRVVFCVCLGRQVYILPRLRVNRLWPAGDSTGAFFVRSPCVLQSSLLWLVPDGQLAPSTQSRV